MGEWIEIAELPARLMTGFCLTRMGEWIEIAKIWSLSLARSVSPVWVSGLKFEAFRNALDGFLRLTRMGEWIRMAEEQFVKN